MLKNLRALRVAENLTCEDMGELIGVTKATYSKKENGQIRLSLKEARILADYFNKSIEELFFDNKVSEIDTGISA